MEQVNIKQVGILFAAGLLTLASISQDSGLQMRRIAGSDGKWRPSDAAGLD